MNSGEVTAQEVGVALFSGAKIVMNGGKITGVDNGPIMGNGTAGRGDVEIVMNGGELVANIQSSGYVACGVYMPNTGSFTMNGGKITANGGAGVVARGGDVKILGGEIITTAHPTLSEGKVGDSRVVVKCAPVVYDKYSSYPGANSLQLEIGANAVLTTSVEDADIIDGIQVLPAEDRSLIVDHRA
mgnify:CR=1 FL=1